MQDAWRAYLGLAMGLTEAPRKKAQDVVRRVVGSGEATATQLQALAEELVSTGAANREALTKLVRFEVDRALGAVGLATADEVAELTRRVHGLERQLREARAGLAEPAPQPSGPPAPAAKKAVAKKAVARKAVARKAVARKAVAKKAVAKKSPAAVSRTEAEEGAAEPARPVKKAPARKRQPGGAA
ncbi:MULTISPECIES: phasin family protein [unclassified Micromonospora]|uniref:phasin family protein n=1 Tax=unclassified Micromonospora TaxID=2617518 RepID=UPI003640C3F8